MTTRSPGLAALLSFVAPGLGQCYAGDRGKGIALLCMTLGIHFAIVMALIGPPMMRSRLTPWLLGIVYLFVWIPAVIDAYQQTSGAATPMLSGGKVWYVIMMLLTVGPMAIPLLWTSQKFSRTAKIVWTTVVILIALLGILVLLVVGPAIERLFGTSLQLLDTLR